MTIKEFVKNTVIDFRRISQERQEEISDFSEGVAALTAADIENNLMPVKVKYPRVAEGIIDIVGRFVSVNPSKKGLQGIYFDAAAKKVIASDGIMMAVADTPEYQQEFAGIWIRQKEETEGGSWIAGGFYKQNTDYFYPRWQAVIPRQKVEKVNFSAIVEKTGYVEAFSNLAKVLKHTGTLSICVNIAEKNLLLDVNRLRKVLQAFRDLKINKITAHVVDEYHPLMLTGGNLQVLLMPLRRATTLGVPCLNDFKGGAGDLPDQKNRKCKSAKMQRLVACA